MIAPTEKAWIQPRPSQIVTANPPVSMMYVTLQPRAKSGGTASNAHTMQSVVTAIMSDRRSNRAVGNPKPMYECDGRWSVRITIDDGYLEEIP